NQVLGSLSGIEGKEVAVLPLHGALPLQQQQLALKPHIEGFRKVILATNIAETSLTIEGIKLVIDSGREQVAQFHPTTGMTELSLKMISQASAEQRKGRAGRVQEGTCYRLWGKEAHSRLAEFALPAIRTEDITSLVLHSADWGTSLDALPLLDQPSEAQLNAASQTLQELRLLDNKGRITPLGKDSLKLPVDVKFASMLLQLKEESELTGDQSLLTAGCVVTALAEESPRTEHWLVSDVLRSLPSAVRQSVSRQASRYARLLGCDVKIDARLIVPEHNLGLAISLARPGWIARARNLKEFKLAMGTGAELVQPAPTELPWLAILTGQRKGANMLIRLAQPIEEQLINAHFAASVSSQHVAFYDAQSDTMKAEERRYFKQILLSRKPLAKLGEAQRIQCWQEWLGEKDIEDWPFFNALEETLNRLNMARAHNLVASSFDGDVPWPDVTARWVLGQEAVHTVLGRCTSLNQLQKMQWPDIFLQTLSWPQRQIIEQQLPASLKVPSGTTRRLRYESASRVVLSVKMQEMYGSATPVTIAQGRQIVTVELLSPAGRPIQTTNDLPRFWQGSYTEVRKDMKGRYPKHYWPEDPTTALASSKTTKNK
ncbi:MAG: ATP-dependent helicase C-terminal domain-containing protein, partial [Pseudomonadota bacterium]|nr:ATP-dependent helicase C-terminal domain-containing protein [Pseudomonadota bacterium]